MLPTPSRNNITDGDAINSKHFSKVFLSNFPFGVKSPDFSHFFSIQNRVPITIPASMSILLNAIGNIVSGCSRKQMVRIHAWWVITTVEDLNLRIETSIGDKPCNPVSPEWRTLSGSNLEHSIPSASKR